MNNRIRIIAAASFALLLVAACSSGGLYGTSRNSDIRGTVDYVDTASHSIYLTNAYSSNGSMLSSGSSGNYRVYYDNNTRVQFQNQSYRPEDLERGDQVDITASQSGNQLLASNVTVTQNVRTSGTTHPNNNYPNGTYNTTLHGIVRSIDTSRQTITLDSGSGSYLTVQYNANTPVYYNGRTYMPSNLEIGDEIDIQGQNLNNGYFSAQNITVTRSVSATSGTTMPSTNMSMLRGTVDYVDTVNHTISLTQTNWIAGFDRNVGNGSTIVVQYDPSAQVNVNGQMYSITGLQRGDVIDMQLQNLGGSSYLARQITLIRDVNAR